LTTKHEQSELTTDESAEAASQATAGLRRRILVYCASSQSCAHKHHEIARQVGEVLALGSRVVVYGGGALGSMGSLADGALDAQGEVVGIQPDFMRELGWSHPRLSSLTLVQTMLERKALMLASSDAVVALPGGSGTLDEVFDAITSKRLGLYFNPIVFLNTDGFFDPCLAMLERCSEERFMHEAHREIWRVVEEPGQLLEAIDSAPEWSKDALQFAAV
jgi:uncharacterized protein (TIGR00730 family)